MLISLIVPCYNEQEALPIFYEESTKVLAGMDCEYEFLFVNDGSKDATLSILKDLQKEMNTLPTFPFRGISVKKRRCMPGLRMRREIMLQ